RRTAGKITTSQRLVNELATLGKVALLPDTAAQDLQQARQKIYVANISLNNQRDLTKSLNETLSSIKPQYDLLQHASEIDSVNVMRQQYKSHANDILKREEEVKNLLKQF